MKQNNHIISNVLPDQRNGDQKHDDLGIVQPYLAEIRSSDGFQKPVQNTVFVVIDHIPDQADTNG